MQVAPRVRPLRGLFQTFTVAVLMAICSMNLGDVTLRSTSTPSMIHESGPISCHPSSLSVATTTATGPLA
eukprot:12901658-Heterocapsa_arctica.AAC.1